MANRFLAIALVLSAFCSVAGAAGPQATVAHWQAAAPMPFAAAGAGSGAILGGAKVLVAGSSLKAQLYDAATNAWKLTAKMDHPLNSGADVLSLRDGRVLVVGTQYGSVGWVSAEIYDPQKDRWSDTGLQTEARFDYTVAVLRDGRVILVGGRADASSANGTASWYYPKSALVFDPASNTWSQIADGPQISDASASVLADGRVLVTGGCTNTKKDPSHDCYPVTSATLFDPAANSWKRTRAMVFAHHGQDSVLLPDGRVLAGAELYDPAKVTWSKTTGSPAGVAAMVLMPTGKALALGSQSASLFDPLTNTWSATAPPPAVSTYPRAAMLANGKVLLTSESTTPQLYTAPGPVLTGVTATPNPGVTALEIRFRASEPATVRAALGTFGAVRATVHAGLNRVMLGLPSRISPGRYTLVVSVKGRTGSDGASVRVSVALPKRSP